MDPSDDATVSPLDNPLARSRSRYKGSRPAKTLQVPLLPVVHNSERNPQLLGNETNQTPALEAKGQTEQRELESEVRGGKATESNVSENFLRRRATLAKQQRKAGDRGSHLEGATHQVSQTRLIDKSQDRREENIAEKRTQIRRHISNKGEQSQSATGTSTIADAFSTSRGNALGPAASARPLPEYSQSAALPSASRNLTCTTSKSRDHPHNNIYRATCREVAPKPAFDAPVSAINTKERRVSVKHDKSVISVPITPSTTSVDIIRYTSSQLSKPIHAESMVLLESFRKVGLERPLRRYERIRDVLNSWDDDAQNALLIVPSPTGGRDDDLDIHNVSRRQPGDVELQLHHSQRLGCWDKRWITLRADGQVLAAKKEGLSNICHLSDFDIYVPTRRQMSKKVRPPKKICFAIKSQQKSSMFLSTENYVHFFCTNDTNLATRWYKAVQEWRSWYLVHILGEGQKEKPPAPSLLPTTSLREQPDATSCEFKPASRDFSHADQNLSTRRAEPVPAESFNVKPNDRFSARYINPQTISASRNLQKSAHSGPDLSRNGDSEAFTGHSLPNPEPEPFSTTGLLGRTYTQRKQSQQERDGHKMSSRRIDLNQTPATAKPSTRAISQRVKQRPLVDLTPQYREPPQHRKGRGIVPDNIPAGGLVEVATSPEQAISIPPATAWKRPSDEEGGFQRPEIVRARNNSSSPGGRAATRESLSPEKSPLTSGLLVSGIQGQGGIVHGRSAKTGKREARSPMVNANEGSGYASGSLLARMETQQGRNKATHINKDEKRG